MTAIVWCFALIAAAGLAVEIANLKWFPRLIPVRSSGSGAILACVAMRNERANAAACVESLLAQPEIRTVAVCDDGSTDGTHEILDALAARDPRVCVVRGRTHSKASALALAVKRAAADFHEHVLFTDADVRLQPGAAGALLQHLQRECVQAVTAWPRARSQSAGEALLSPMVTLTLLQLLPMWRSRSGDPRFTAGNGQLFLVERRAYARCGGHARIADAVEDVALARALAACGERVAFACGASIASVEGYGTFSAAASGLGRSLFASAGIAGCAAFALWQICGFVLPFASIPIAPVAASFGSSCALAARILLAARMRQPVASVLTAPVGALAAATAAIVIAARGSRGRLAWRGRMLAQ